MLLRMLLLMFLLLSACAGQRSLPGTQLEPVIDGQALGTVQGQVDCGELNDCQGLAVLWPLGDGIPPDPRQFTLIPAFVEPLATEGKFTLSAPPGSYFVGAFVRLSAGPLFGPPRIGDRIYLTPDSTGTAFKVELQAGETQDSGLHSRAWTFQGMSNEPRTGIKGTVLDVNNQPVAGVLVFAFADREVSTMPLTVSTRTDSAGAFILPLVKGGTVYLRVRKNYQGGQPLPGDFVGVFGGAIARPLPVAEGQVIEGLILRVHKIPQQMLKKPQHLEGKR